LFGILLRLFLEQSATSERPLSAEAVVGEEVAEAVGARCQDHHQSLHRILHLLRRHQSLPFASPGAVEAEARYHHPSLHRILHLLPRYHSLLFASPGAVEVEEAAVEVAACRQAHHRSLHQVLRRGLHLAPVKAEAVEEVAEALVVVVAARSAKQRSPPATQTGMKGT
jgi:hypothetical protein